MIASIMPQFGGKTSLLNIRLAARGLSRACPLAIKGTISHSAAMARVQVLIPLALTQHYDYLVPDTMQVTLGSFVRVPFGKRHLDGVVWSQGHSDIAVEKLRFIDHCYDVAPLAADLRSFVDWVAAYTMTPPGAVLRLVMRAPEALHPPKLRRGWRASEARPQRLTPARKRVFEVFGELSEGAALTTAQLADASGASAAIIRSLGDGGYLQAVSLPAEPPSKIHSAPSVVQLSDAQSTVAADLRTGVTAQNFSVHLLDGITGSGKTEVYFEAIDAALQQGQAALILLPEISLTSQFLDRFTERFGAPPAIWHSALTASERRQTWRDVSAGHLSVLVGARSALFLPWPDLGVIIVDEEHDAGFKQDDGVIYNARDMAVVRARHANCPIILASATPSLETLINAQHGRYQHHRLTARAGDAQLPNIDLVDMRQSPPPKGRWLVSELVSRVAQSLEDGKQSLIFLNRRGYAPLTLCRSCGHRYACPHCDAWLVEHRFRQELMCHHCGFTRSMPHQCDACAAPDALTACGPGIERITEEVVDLFPTARIAVLSSDLKGGTRQLSETLLKISEGAADIIIGTQIVAKGHHFPGLNFVGVVDADLGLGNGDLRAAERTYQLLLQVSGRAGRATDFGHALLQTHMPDHPVLKALVAGDRDGFLAREAEARASAGMPPFGRLAALILSGPNQAEVLAGCRALSAHIPSLQGVRILGPAPSAILRLRNRYRYRFLVKAERQIAIQDVIRRWLAAVDMPRAIRLSIDIDPYNFM